MVTEIVKEKPDQINLKNSNGSRNELSDIPLADSFDAVSCSLDNLIAQNADFVAFD